MKRLRAWVRSLRPSQQEVRLTEPLLLRSGRVRVADEGTPIAVELIREGVRLEIHRERFLSPFSSESGVRFLLLNPTQCGSGICGFMRLTHKGDSLILGRQPSAATLACDFLHRLELRHLEITHDGDGLIFRKLVSDAEVRLSSVPEAPWCAESQTRQAKSLQRIGEIYGGPLEPLPAEQALETLKEVNRLLAHEAHRPLNREGAPGGVVTLPEHLTPIIVGDLHAQVNNLLTLLSKNHFLEAMEAGEAALIILGDAVHSEMAGKLEAMEDSMLMMDLIFRLKLRFPDQLFYVRGNHDSFSGQLTKFGVAQCLLWEAALRAERGEPYLEEMQRLYETLPYVVLSPDFIACHAAPIKTRFDYPMLVDIRQNDSLIPQLIKNRLRRRTAPAGYTHSDVSHFRQALKLPEETPFFVSHSPMDRKHAQWLEAGGIKNHHIVFSANLPWIGLFTRVGGRMIPLEYHVENLRPGIGRPHASEEVAPPGGHPEAAG